MRKIDRIKSRKKMERAPGQRSPDDDAIKGVSAGMTDVRKKLAMAGLLLGGIAGGFGLYAGKNSPTVDAVKIETTAVPDDRETEKEDPEVETQKLIERVESGFGKFGEKVKPLIDAGISDERLKAELLKPFKLVENNKANPFKNAEIFQSKFGGKVEGADVNFFIYALFEIYERHLPERVAASYQHGRRALMLRKNFDPNSVASLMILYHELIHAGDDIELLKADTPEHKEWRGQDSGSVVNDEMKAYAAEVEILNLLLKNELKNAVTNNTDVDTDEYLFRVCSSLGIKSNDPNIVSIKDILHASRYYYPEGIKNGLVPKPFYDELVRLIPELKLCDNPGGKCHITTPEGGVKAINPGRMSEMEAESRRFY